MAEVKAMAEVEAINEVEAMAEVEAMDGRGESNTMILCGGATIAEETI